MSDIVIKAEGLGKKYRISHEAPERYMALRDVIHKKAKGIFGEKQQTTREDFWALKDVNFEIKRGEAVGIIGRNGAGKSTLLKILSRITEPTEGRVEIEGRTSALLEVGTGFHPELTGRENIFLNGAILGMNRAEIKKKFDAIVEFSGVEKFLDTPVKRYSTGMYLRLAFAVAAHLEPEILIVDEVLAVGDAEFQKKCLGKMNEVSKKEGRTVLFVSHNLKAITDFCNRSIWIEDGKIKQDSSANEVISNYVNSSNLISGEETVSKNIDKKFISLNEINTIEGSGQKKKIFELENKIGIAICIKNISWTEEFMLGFGLNTLSKGRVLTDTAEFSPLIVGSESKIVVWLPSEELTPNKYFVDVSIMSKDKALLDLEINSTSFEIAISNTKFETMEYDYGIMNKKLVWQQIR